MRSKHTLITVLFALLITLLPLTIVSYAAGDIEVTLTGSSRRLQTSDSNFFKAFDGIVSGETRTQKINIHNNYARKAGFYIITGRSVSAYDDLSSKVIISLSRGAETLYEGKVSDVPGRISLGYLPPAGSQTINLSLTLPSDIGSEIAGKSLSSRWRIAADVYDEGGTGGGGDTGGGGASGGTEGGSDRHISDPGYTPPDSCVVTHKAEPLIPGQTEVLKPGEAAKPADIQGETVASVSPDALSLNKKSYSLDTSDKSLYLYTSVINPAAQKAPCICILLGLILLLLLIVLILLLTRGKKEGDDK